MVVPNPVSGISKTANGATASAQLGTGHANGTSTSIHNQHSLTNPSGSAPVPQRTSISVVKELSDLLQTGLNQEQIQICVELLECGINPRHLADFIKKCRRT